MKTKPKTKSEPAISAVKPTRVVFLLDRTGSMSTVKAETISGFNGYLDTLKGAPNTTITVVQFDTLGIDKLCDGVAVAKCPRLNDDNYQPRAMTPLYDALGRTISETRGHKGLQGHKVLFITLTDGEENASTEWTSDKVKALIKECEDQDKWTFAYIGVGPQGWAAMKAVAIGTQCVSNVLNIAQDGKSVTRMYRRAGGQSVSYACSIGSDIQKDFWGKEDES